MCVENCKWVRKISDHCGAELQDTVDGGFIITGFSYPGDFLLKIDDLESSTNVFNVPKKVKNNPLSKGAPNSIIIQSFRCHASSAPKLAASATDTKCRS